MRAVTRDAHNLGILRCETATIRFVSGELRASNGRERKGEECDNDVRLSAPVGEFEWFVAVIGLELKIGGDVPHLQSRRAVGGRRAALGDWHGGRVRPPR